MVVAINMADLVEKRGNIIDTKKLSDELGCPVVMISGIILKKFKPFAGEPAPFVIELPAYHVPSVGNVLRTT